MYDDIFTAIKKNVNKIKVWWIIDADAGFFYNLLLMELIVAKS